MIFQRLSNYLLIFISANFYLFTGSLVFISNSHAAKCLYISSYHEQYEWDKGIRSAMKPILSEHCELKVFFMDTKRNKKPLFAQQKAQQALHLIKQYKPDVIIAADDNASRYLVVPFLKDKQIPIVFCGINNSVEPYGYPFKNATGMVEVSPDKIIIQVLKETISKVRQGVFLSANVLSQRRMYEQMEKSFAKSNIKLLGRFVTSQKDWENAWQEANKTDFIFIGNPEGISDWDDLQVRKFISEHSKSLTITSWRWLSPLAMLTISKLPQEQGEWAAKVAVEILNGVSPDKIPVVSNYRWDMYKNSKLLKQVNIKLPIGIIHNAQESSL